MRGTAEWGKGGTARRERRQGGVQCAHDHNEHLADGRRAAHTAGVAAAPIAGTAVPQDGQNLAGAPAAGGMGDPHAGQNLAAAGGAPLAWLLDQLV